MRGVPVIATTARKARFASIKDGYVLKSRQGNLRLSNTYNQQFLMTKQLLTLGKQRLVIHYDDYQQISGQWIPMQIRYEGQAKGETVQLEFAFRKAEINSEIRTPFSIPKSYTRYMKKLLLVLLLGIFCGELYGQDARARLESQRKQLQQEIVQINGMLQKNKSQKADALESLEDLFLKIDRLRELLRLTNRQINGLTSQINSNQAKITPWKKNWKS